MKTTAISALCALVLTSSASAYVGVGAGLGMGVPIGPRLGVGMGVGHTYYPQGQPAAGPNAAPVAKPEFQAPRYTLDVQGMYGFRAMPASRYAGETYGVEIEGAKYLDRNSAFTLSLGIMSAGSDDRYWVQDTGTGVYYPWTNDYTRTSFTLMGGYRFTKPLGKRVELNFGVKCGLDVQNLSITDGIGYGYYWDDDKDNTAVGFAYAASAGISVRLTPNVAVEAGYQYFGSTAKPKVRAIYANEPDYSTSTVRYHQIKLGVRCYF